ncbi:hypothetical protein JCM8097_003796 [Rhodosporidiobolus ruineniae]
MHVFFTLSFEPLQAMLVDCLAEEGVHAVLPLLGVNRQFRKLAVARLLKEYEKTQIVDWEGEGAGDNYRELPVLSEGEYILVHESSCNPYDGPFAYDDPRYHLARVKEKKSRQSSCPLLLSSFDPATMLCTFKPSPRADGVEYSLVCDMNHDEFRDLPRFFELHPTAWFCSSSPSSTCAHEGLELAARPDRHPPVGNQVLSPKTPKNPGPVTEESILGLMAGDWSAERRDPFDPEWSHEKDMKMRCGWTICTSYNVMRFDFGADDSDPFDVEMVNVPAHFMVKELKVPFIDLFVPRRCTKEPGFYAD